MVSFSEADVRASDEERERVVSALRDHAGAGRLEPSELEERVEAALAARTLGDLEPLLADLPGPTISPSPAPPVRRRGNGRARRLQRLAFVAVLLVAIWAATGAGDPFWPFWPLVGLGILAMKGGACGRRRRACAKSQRTDAVWL
jgi:hypothetical protein